jgi:hypothetical protein
MMVLHLLLTAVFLVYLCACRPFQSKFTVARTIIVEIVLFAIQGMFAIYQYYAQSLYYIKSLELYIILAVVLLLGLAIVFLILEQYKVWYEMIRKCCEGCCLSFRLKGRSYQL